MKGYFDIPCSIFYGSEKVLTKPIVAIATVSCVGKSQDKERGRTFYEFIKLKRQSFNIIKYLEGY